MRFVQAEKPVTTAHEVLGKIEFTVEVPEAESVAEATMMCGGEDRLLNFFNGQIATNAKNMARAYARNYEVAKEADPSTYPTLIEAIATKGREYAHDYTPSAESAGPSVKAKAAKLDAVQALVDSGKEFTLDELRALLATAK